MSAARIFPLASPIFVPREARLTLRAKALLAQSGQPAYELFDRFLRLDWSDKREFEEGMGDLRSGRRFFVTMTKGTEPPVGVTCEPRKRAVTIETEAEYLHRLEPKRYGPDGEWPGKMFGKGRYTAPPCEVVKAAKTEEAGT